MPLFCLVQVCVHPGLGENVFGWLSSRRELAFPSLRATQVLTYSHHASQAPAKRAKNPHPRSQAQGRFLHRTNQAKCLMHETNHMYAASSGSGWRRCGQPISLYRPVCFCLSRSRFSDKHGTDLLAPRQPGVGALTRRSRPNQ